MPPSRNAVSRRQMIKAGVLGTAFSLSSYLRLQAEAGKPDEGRSAILVFLGGGPSHQDTFDLKPQAPAEYRGQFRPIRTAASGVEICEHMPKLARSAEKFAIIRGITHNLAAHSLGTRYMHDGQPPDASAELSDVRFGSQSRVPQCG